MGELLYKWLKAGGLSPYQDYAWPMPNGKPGKWARAKGALVLCGNGIHACAASQVVHHIAATLWELEYQGKRIDGDDKVCVRAGRLIRQLDGINEQTLRLFAADCAERMLAIFERARSTDTRPRDAIIASRRYAFGLIHSAAKNAAEVAARAAAWDAAGAAARAAAWAAAGDAAEVAAGVAAGDAAWVAAWAAARAAAWEWQSARLLDYAYGRVDLDAIRKSVAEQESRDG